MSQTIISVDAAELATILAALRFYQREGQGEPSNRCDDIHHIATDGDTQISLNSEGIDALCEPRIEFYSKLFSFLAEPAANISKGDNIITLVMKTLGQNTIRDFCHTCF